MPADFSSTDYNEYYLRPGISAWRDICASDKAQYFASSLLFIKNHYFPARSCIRVADYGAGTGALCSAIISLLGEDACSFVFEQFELSMEAIMHAKSNSIDIHPLADFTKLSPFDVIISCHVLEHLDNPRQFLSSIKSSSQYVIAEVPLELTVFTSRLLKPSPTGHINFFNQFLFQSLFFTSGFRSLKVSLYNPALVILRHSGISFPLFRWFIKQILLIVSPGFAQYIFSYHCHGIFALQSESD